MPDIDIDFCIERRGEVIDYIKDQYGDNSVTQIITFGKMKARQVVRDVGRVLGYTFGEIDKLAKMIPTTLNITLKEALEQSPELKNASENEFKEVMDYSRVLEGMNRHASIHAAGVVIAPGELTSPIIFTVNISFMLGSFDMEILSKSLMYVGLEGLALFPIK